MKKISFFSIAILLSFSVFSQSISSITKVTLQPDYRAKAKELVGKMTLEEKASLCSGLDHWTTKPIEHLGIPSVTMSDGPHGIRRSSGSSFSTVGLPATCFPTASALASSWNIELAKQAGIALADECQALDKQILLGPGVNMKRSPLGGRNFEYFSEDPLLAGKMAAAFINGVQSQGIGTSLKHFAANNQEFERTSNSSNIDERTLNEIYLPAFEIAVKEAQPWTVMCSYNRLNGVLCSENEWLLKEILKKKWGFKGYVMSDWGAVNERTLGVQAGMHLEMPGSGGYNDKKIVEAVKSGSLTEARLDEIVTDLLAVNLKAKDLHKPNAPLNEEQHNDLARKISGECIVLLKNDNSILPVNLQNIKKIALIGGFAKVPRYQGAGSSHVTPTKLSNVFDELNKMAGSTVSISYAEGYTTEATTSDAILADAQQQAKNAEVAIVFAGLPDIYESEGYDRKNIDLPQSHQQLIEAVAKVQPNTIVVLMNGSAVAMPWANKVKGIVEGWLGGQGGGGALADVLTGKVNPSGKLSETFPVKLEDTPPYPNFPGKNGEANYSEGIFIGYRYYDKKKIAPLFPFGYGLSYTTFAYSAIKTNTTSANDTDKIIVEVKVKNTGKVAGKEVVELYVHDNNQEVVRPEKELKHFTKVELQPGEEKTVNFELGYRDFAYYSEAVHDWQTSTGNYTILAGGSSDNLPLTTSIDLQSTHVLYPKLTRNSPLKDFGINPKNKALYEELMSIARSTRSELNNINAAMKEDEQGRKNRLAMFNAIFNDMPIYKLVARTQGKYTEEMLADFLKRAE